MIFGALGQFALGQFELSASAAGAVLTASASLIAGSATGAASVAKQVLSDGTTIIEGAAAGSASAVGATLTTTASLIAGPAAADASAPGDLVTANMSVIAGAASAANDNSDNSIGWWGPPRYVDRLRRRDAEAPGAELVVVASLLPGKARGGIDEELVLLDLLLDLKIFRKAA